MRAFVAALLLMCTQAQNIMPLGGKVVDNSVEIEVEGTYNATLDASHGTQSNGNNTNGPGGAVPANANLTNNIKAPDAVHPIADNSRPAFESHGDGVSAVPQTDMMHASTILGQGNEKADITTTVIDTSTVTVQGATTTETVTATTTTTPTSTVSTTTTTTQKPATVTSRSTVTTTTTTAVLSTVTQITGTATSTSTAGTITLTSTSTAATAISTTTVAGTTAGATKTQIESTTDGLTRTIWVSQMITVDVPAQSFDIMAFLGYSSKRATV